MARYSVNNYTVDVLLADIKSGNIAIPEMQRPFVWDATQVRDLMDSLYKGFPVGYIIVWQNPSVKLKDGTVAIGKKVLIDGQQRITAMAAAIVGQEVLDSHYKWKRVCIAFNPIDEIFEVANSANQKSSKWIPDIAKVLDVSFGSFSFVMEYCQKNGIMDKAQEINDTINRLRAIQNNSIGVITLAEDLDIDSVTEIFIRINSKGVVLSQADFAMSKISSNEIYNGNVTRKTIDYFCHLLESPEDLKEIKKNDAEFAARPEFEAIKWAAAKNAPIYRTCYTDILRVAFTYKFKRGKLADLVSLLSGRDFVTKEFREDIVEESYGKLDAGIMNFINQYNFSQFVMAIKGAGYVSSKLLNSRMTLDFVYTLYLMLLDDPTIPNAQIKRYVQKWFVLSTLTSRYIGSPETQMDRDMRTIGEKGFLTFLADVEASALSETFWTVTLPQNLETSSVNSPAFNTFLAAQINMNCNSMLMNGTKVADLITISGDVHHIFPRSYLKNNGVDNKTKYNQVANYIYLDTQVNKAISDDAPNVYFGKVLNQCDGGNIVLGNIADRDLLATNLEENCIPQNIMNMTVENYDEFLTERRKMMAALIQKYYERL